MEVTVVPYTPPSAGFFETISTFCTHLAPVVGDLAASIGATAAAIDQASRTTPEADR